MSASADDHEPPSPTLFMDWAGSAHRSLNGETHRDLKRSSRPHDLPSDYTLAFPGAIDFAPSNRCMAAAAPAPCKFWHWIPEPFFVHPGYRSRL